MSESKSELSKELFAKMRRDYKRAKGTISFGMFIQALGGGLGIAIPIIALMMTESVDHPLFRMALSFGVGLLLTSLFFGMLIAGVGRIIKANLDQAVQTSPYLDESGKISLLLIK